MATAAKEQADARPSDVNAAHYSAVATALQAIVAHPAFDGISSQAPLSLNEGGQCSPFDLTEFKMKMNKKEVYTCGANLLWINNIWSSASQVPVNRTGVAALRSYMLRFA